MGKEFSDNAIGIDKTGLSVNVNGVVYACVAI
jgi:hypothetical protein